MDITLKRILELIGPRHGAGKELAEYLGIHPNVITGWRNGSLRSYRRYIPEIAKYFEVSEDYLNGLTDTKKAPAKQEPNDEDIKFALFGGADNITDEMYEEVKAFAKFVEEREKKKRK